MASGPAWSDLQVKRDDDVHGWIGASPDGLIASLQTSAGACLTQCSEIQTSIK